MQYVAKINCAFNIISIAHVGRSENIARHYDKYLQIRRIINKCYTVKCSETCIHKKCYSAFHNQTYIYLVYIVIHNIKI